MWQIHGQTDRHRMTAKAALAGLQHLEQLPVCIDLHVATALLIKISGAASNYERSADW